MILVVFYEDSQNMRASQIKIKKILKIEYKSVFVRTNFTLGNFMPQKTDNKKQLGFALKYLE